MLAVVVCAALLNGKIVAEGAYPRHLQGVAKVSNGNPFWSFTTTLVGAR